MSDESVSGYVVHYRFEVTTECVSRLDDSLRRGCLEYVRVDNRVGRGLDGFRYDATLARLVGLRVPLGLLAHNALPSVSMSSSRILPPAPLVKLEPVEDLTPQQPSGFCKLIRRRLTAQGQNLPPSPPFVYDWLERRALDAVVVAAYYFDAEGVPWVYLRSATRPPVLLRQPSRLPRAEWLSGEGLWELAAGLIEVEEETSAGVVRCACRELEEELGFTVVPELMRPLGPSSLPSPGVVGERHFFFCVKVEPDQRKVPSLDGSALEQLGAIISVSLGDALLACRNGELEDAKTELGLRRLADELGFRV